MNAMHSVYLLQHGLADLRSHHQVVVQIHKNKCILGRGLLCTDNLYDILVCWLLFQIVE